MGHVTDRLQGKIWKKWPKLGNLLAKIFTAKAFAIICGWEYVLHCSVRRRETSALKNCIVLCWEVNREQWVSREFGIALPIVHVAVMGKDTHFWKGERLQKEMGMEWEEVFISLAFLAPGYLTTSFTKTQPTQYGQFCLRSLDECLWPRERPGSGD